MTLDTRYRETNPLTFKIVLAKSHEKMLMSNRVDFSREQCPGWDLRGSVGIEGEGGAGAIILDDSEVQKKPSGRRLCP